ncbi:MAG: PAS domain S-box protein [Anaerolineae bacterium]|nr:PAS domain S-box protein [Anaerolineae bacterium]
MISDTKQRAILYVEDDEILARLFQKHLKRAGYDVDIAMDGASGLAKYHDKDYDIVILDQNLPVLSGLEVLKKLMSDDANTPIIMLSGLGGEDLVIQALNYGAADFIIKDVDGGYLRLMPIIIEKVIRQKQLEIEKRVAEEVAQKAAQRFQHLVENISDLIGIVDVAGTIRYASPSIKTMLGYSQLSEIFEIVHPDDLDRFQELLIQMSKQAHYTRIPLAICLKHDNGSWHWMEGTITNLLTEPTIRGFVINLHDITSIRQAQQELEQERNILRTLIDVIPDRIYVKDTDGYFILCNESARAIQGFESLQDMIGKTIIDIGGEAFRPYHEMDLQVMEKNEAIINREDSFKEKWYIINKIPLQDKGGVVTGMAGVRSDITERKQYEQKIIKHNLRLLNLQGASGVIASNLSFHEVVETIVAEIAQLTGFQICTVSNWNREEDTVKAIVSYDLLDRGYHKWDMIYHLRDYPVTKQVLTDWDIVQQTISQVDLDESEKQYMLEEDLKSLVMLPIVVQGQAMALVELEDGQVERTLDAEEIVIVELLLHQAGIAMQNAYLFENIQQQAQEIQRASSRYHALFEQSHDGVILMDTQGTYIGANQRAYDMLGYDSSKLELLGLSYRERSTPSSRHQSVERLRQLNDGEKLAPYERILRKRDGTEFHAEILTELVQDDVGNPLHIQCIVRDITERKRIEQALLEHQERLHVLHAMASQSSADVETILQNALKNASQLLGLDVGIISKIEDNIYTIQHVSAPPEVELLSGQIFDLADTFCELVYASDEMVSITHASATKYKKHPCYEKTNLECYVGAPLIVDGKRFGTLNFSSQTPVLKRLQKLTRILCA